MTATLSVAAIHHCVAASASRARSSIVLWPILSPRRPHHGVVQIAMAIGPA